MAKQMKKVKKPQKIQTTIKEKKPKQGHKLVWFTIIVTFQLRSNPVF